MIYFIFECIYLQNSNVTAKSHALLGKKMWWRNLCVALVQVKAFMAFPLYTVFSKAMVMSRVIRDHQWPWKSHGASAGLPGRLLQRLEETLVLKLTLPAEEPQYRPFSTREWCWRVTPIYGSHQPWVTNCILLVLKYWLKSVSFVKKMMQVLPFFLHQLPSWPVILGASILVHLLSFLDRNGQRSGHRIFPLITRQLSSCH